MNKQKDGNMSNYAQEEKQLSAQSTAFIKLLTQRGILEDTDIVDDKIRQAQKNKKQHTYHNTEMLLRHYRNIVWALECFPDTIAEELDKPMHDLDALLDSVDLACGMGNRKLESRMESIKKSRLLLERMNDALSVLKRKPDNGEKMYNLIYMTYVSPEKLAHNDLLFRLDISSRHYYRLRQQAINILAIRLWSVPATEMGTWLVVMMLLEELG